LIAEAPTPFAHRGCTAIFSKGVADAWRFIYRRPDDMEPLQRLTLLCVDGRVLTHLRRAIGLNRAIFGLLASMLLNTVAQAGGRATRLVGAFAAGRIINPRLVRSQLYGGMIWGVSFALHEGASVDRRSGRVMNADLGEYHLRVNADVSSVKALLIHEDDAYVNELGIKGVGEIGITGTVGAIANAVWHATGARVREFPVRIEEIAALTIGAV
jgi:Molybdopterin-binding domain of aldehyde dehydrogenase